MTSDPKLRRWLLKYNRLHFAGELPVERIVIYWEPTGRASASTDYIDGEYVIRLDPMQAGLPRKVKLDINHEMAHVKLWPLGKKIADHGNRFDAEIQHLCSFRSYRKLL
jgi:predicted SprT family Zn-dependent metalloprotease